MNVFNPYPQEYLNQFPNPELIRGISAAEPCYQCSEADCRNSNSDCRKNGCCRNVATA